jgi:hypothetical protein
VSELSAKRKHLLRLLQASYDDGMKRLRERPANWDVDADALRRSYNKPRPTMADLYGMSESHLDLLLDHYDLARRPRCVW